MTFEVNNLRPIGRNSTTANIVWFYLTSTDALADITAPGYFTGVTGLSILDLILASGTDGTVEIRVSAIDGSGTVTPVITSGGVAALNVSVDQANLTDIGGGTLNPNVQANLERIHNRVNLKVQKIVNVGSGTGLSIGDGQTQDPSEKEIGLRSIAAGNGIALEVINDSVVITALAQTNPDPGGGGGGGSGGSNGSKIPPAPADLGFGSGNALRYVSKNTALNPIGGETASSKHTSIQAGINAANPGDIVLVRSDTYFETVSITNKAGSIANPIWIVAEERGKAFLSGLQQAATRGTASWTNQGGGVFSLANQNRPYIGSHNDDFLMYFKSESDLRASTVQGVTKPSYGMGFAPAGGSTASNATGTLFVRLRGNVNPNGQSVKFTDNFGVILLDVNNSDNIIFDGFVIEGGGTAESINVDTSSSNFVLRNCVITHARFGIRPNTGTTLSVCEFLQTGLGKWAKEVAVLDGVNANGVFTLVKEYYNETVIGGSSGSALLEGGIDVGRSPIISNFTIERCLLGPTFDGSKIGRHKDSELRDSVMFQCRDDGVEVEGFQSIHTGDGIEVHDNRFIDCFVAWSRQDANINGESFLYRNVIENRDPDLRHNTLFLLKTIKTTLNSVDQVYHNTIINISNPGATSQFLWYDFSNGSGNTIRNLKNNIIVFVNAFTNSGGPNPQSIGGNAFAGPVSNAVIQANGGIFTGTTEASMQLNADLSLKPGSPAVGRAVAISGAFPDTGLNQDDAGAFPLGVSPGTNWPRERTRTFDLTKPSNWPK